MDHDILKIMVQRTNLDKFDDEKNTAYVNPCYKSILAGRTQILANNKLLTVGMNDNVDKGKIFIPNLAQHLVGTLSMYGISVRPTINTLPVKAIKFKVDLRKSHKTGVHLISRSRLIEDTKRKLSGTSFNDNHRVVISTKDISGDDIKVVMQVLRIKIDNDPDPLIENKENGILVKSTLIFLSTHVSNMSLGLV